MPKIKGTDWYTAAALRATPIEGSERCSIGMVYGYRRSLAGLPEEEKKAQIEALKKQGIIAIEKKSQHDHTDIPAGTSYLEVMDQMSVSKLETLLAKKGIEFPANRFDIYKQSLIQSKRRR